MVRKQIERMVCRRSPREPDRRKVVAQENIQGIDTPVTPVTGAPSPADGTAPGSVSYGYTSGVLTLVSNLPGRTTSFSYDSAGNLASVTAPVGATTGHRVTSVAQPTATSAQAITRFTYPAGQTLIANANSNQSQAVTAAAPTTYDRPPTACCWSRGHQPHRRGPGEDLGPAARWVVANARHLAVWGLAAEAWASPSFPQPLRLRPSPMALAPMPRSHGVTESRTRPQRAR